MPTTEHILLFLLQVVAFWAIWKILDSIYFHVKPKKKEAPPPQPEPTSIALFGGPALPSSVPKPAPTPIQIINKASKFELLEIPGIGKKTVERIIQNRPFRDFLHVRNALSGRAAKLLLEWAKQKLSETSFTTDSP